MFDENAAQVEEEVFEFRIGVGGIVMPHIPSVVERPQIEGSKRPRLVEGVVEAPPSPRMPFFEEGADGRRGGRIRGEEQDAWTPHIGKPDGGGGQIFLDDHVERGQAERRPFGPRGGDGLLPGLLLRQADPGKAPVDPRLALVGPVRLAVLVEQRHGARFRADRAAGGRIVRDLRDQAEPAVAERPALRRSEFDVADRPPGGAIHEEAVVQVLFLPLGLPVLDRVLPVPELPDPPGGGRALGDEQPDPARLVRRAVRRHVLPSDALDVEAVDDVDAFRPDPPLRRRQLDPKAFERFDDGPARRVREDRRGEDPFALAG